ncbi:MAG: aminotransferase class IV [Acidobacteriota bacterium]
MRVHLNGRLVDESEARVSVFDRGLLFGDGIFETMRAVAGQVFRIERHLGRLRQSAARVRLELPWSGGRLERSVRDVLRANGLRDARVRLTVTRGRGLPGNFLEALGPPTLVIAAFPFDGLDEARFRGGVAAAVSSRQAIPARALDPAIKSISRLSSVLARQEAHARGAYEAILVDGRGDLTEGAASNLFLVLGGRLVTPPVPEGGLPGITREAVIELARSAGIGVEERALPAARIRAAAEVFLTNTSWEVLPVTRVDGRPVGDGRPGPVSRELHARYRRLLREECGDA